jgi:hypothetical protein
MHESQQSDYDCLMEGQGGGNSYKGSQMTPDLYV